LRRVTLCFIDERIKEFICEDIVEIMGEYFLIGVEAAAAATVFGPVGVLKKILKIFFKIVTKDGIVLGGNVVLDEVWEVILDHLSISNEIIVVLKIGFEGRERAPP
jgi:hypothetical protein